MGFIDYRGTKEDRYSDVLEFAQSQQQEEARQLEDELVGKWITKLIGDSRYTTLDIGDLIKYVMVKYKNLLQQRDKLIGWEAEDSHLDHKILWNDLCIALITKRLETAGISEEKRNTYYQTFVEKVFKLNGATTANIHYECIMDNPSYKRYFSDCFDLVQAKQFWKWLGHIGANDKVALIEFVNAYEQLSILTGYYLFQGIRPEGHNWLQRLDIEHKVFERLSIEYEMGRFKEPDYSKLRNPLYELKKSEDTLIHENRPEDVSYPIDEPRKPGRPHLDRNRFEELLKQQNLLSYVEACKLLIKCALPEEMDNLFKELIIRIPVLQESMDKFREMYQPDMYQFYEYYIPEALQLTVSYIEYLDVGIGEKILIETEREVLDAVKKLLIAVNDTIDEIYKFASMEIKAKAKALESIMSQDGHVDQNFKIN